MPLKFVFGPSGSGKSTYLYQHVIEESEKNPQVKLFYVSPVGINQIAENLSCLNWAFSGFIKSGNTLFLKLDQKPYEIDDITKTLRLVKDFGLNKVRA